MSKQRATQAKLFSRAFVVFVALYMLTGGFCVYLSRFAESKLVNAANLLIVYSFLALIGVLALLARSSLSAWAGDSDHGVDALRSAAVTFQSAVCGFFVAFLLWVMASGGVTKCAFAGLLTTAPMFFLLRRPSTAYSLWNKQGSADWKVQVEGFFRVVAILAYVASVLSIDLSFLRHWPGGITALLAFDNPLVRPPASGFSDLISRHEYQAFGIVVFLGSVACLLFSVEPQSSIVSQMRLNSTRRDGIQGTDEQVGFEEEAV